MAKPEYPGLEDQLKRFATELDNEKTKLLFKIGYKLGYDANQGFVVCPECQEVECDCDKKPALSLDLCEECNGTGLLKNTGQLIGYIYCGKCNGTGKKPLKKPWRPIPNKR